MSNDEWGSGFGCAWMVIGALVIVFIVLFFGSGFHYIKNPRYQIVTNGEYYRIKEPMTWFNSQKYCLLFESEDEARSFIKTNTVDQLSEIRQKELWEKVSEVYKNGKK